MNAQIHNKKYGRLESSAAKKKNRDGYTQSCLVFMEMKFTLFVASNVVEQVADNSKILPVGRMYIQTEDKKSL